jgi:amidase
LHGLPITLKDSHDTEGVVTTGGTKGRASHVPAQDSAVAGRLRKAGAILLGKTNTPELTLSAETVNLVYGQTRNPYDTERSPGGSSGGAGSIIAAGGSPLDMGSDTGGSIRYPAHFCGIAGLKPTSGRVPRTGHIVPYAMGATDAFTTIGPMARFVEDLILAFPIIAGTDWHDPTIVDMPIGDPASVAMRGLRVAVYSDNGVYDSTPETKKAVADAAKALSDAGAIVTEDRPDVFERMGDLPNSVSGGDGRAWTKRLLERYGTTEPHPVLAKRIAEAKEVSASEFTAHLEHLDTFRSEMLTWMQSYDLILAPVAAFPALPVGQSMEEPYSKGLSYASAYNMTGWPATVVRAGTSPEGMPIGVQVVARPWREDVSLAAALVLEKALGGWKKPNL